MLSCYYGNTENARLTFYIEGIKMLFISRMMGKFETHCVVNKPSKLQYSKSINYLDVKTGN